MDKLKAVLTLLEEIDIITNTEFVDIEKSIGIQVYYSIGNYQNIYEINRLITYVSERDITLNYELLDSCIKYFNIKEYPYLDQTAIDGRFGPRINHQFFFFWIYAIFYPSYFWNFIASEASKNEGSVSLKQLETLEHVPEGPLKKQVQNFINYPSITISTTGKKKIKLIIQEMETKGELKKIVNKEDIRYFLGSDNEDIEYLRTSSQLAIFENGKRIFVNFTKGTKVQRFIDSVCNSRYGISLDSLIEKDIMTKDESSYRGRNGYKGKMKSSKISKSLSNIIISKEEIGGKIFYRFGGVVR